MKKSIGALFDWDGVVVDSGAAHEASWIELARLNNLSLPDGFFKSTFGKRNVDIITKILAWTSDPQEAQRLSDQKEVIYREHVSKFGIATIEGAVEFIRALNKESIPCAVGSSTPRANLEQALDVTGLRPYFTAWATSEDVSRGKPEPDVYLKAAQKIGIVPTDCAVFEDAVAGIVAASKAGAKKVAVASTNPVSFWASRTLSYERPDAIIPNFSNFTPTDLRRIFCE